MEAAVSRLPFWLHELIAEAKRRARQRRLLVVLLLVVVAGATTAVVLRPSGGGSRSGGPSGRVVGGTPAGSDAVHFGAFVLTVPKGFRQYEVGTGKSLEAFWVAQHPRAVSTGVRLPARAAYLWVQGNTGTPSFAHRLPLDLHKLHRDPPLASGTMWQNSIYGGHEGYLVTVFEGSKASAADRAAIERALRSIRRAN
jgi:hypothetical protein